MNNKPTQGTSILGLEPFGADTRGSRQLDVIWNVTAVCPWDCADCCVAALHVKQKNNKLFVSSPDLNGYREIPSGGDGTLYDKALRVLQAEGIELNLSQKLAVLDNIKGENVRLDVSGGDVLAPAENYELLQQAARRLGKSNVTLTATGAGLARYDVASLANLIAEMNFTYDGVPDPDNPLRPSTYAQGNLRKAKQFAAAGVSTRAECPLSPQNLEPAALTRIYRDLHDAGIDKLLLMRLFPVGRGEMVPEAVPTNEEYRRAIATLRQLEVQYGSPTVKLQCALRLMEGPSATNHCDAITESFGLLWDGTLLGSPWALNKFGRPVDEAWVLGNLVQCRLTDILASDKVVRLRARAQENHGMCKIFAWLNGRSDQAEDRMFERTDPMYALPGSTLGGAA